LSSERSKKMRKLSVVLGLLLVFLILGAVGCSSAQNGGEQAKEPVSKEMPKLLNLATTSVGSGINAMGSGMAVVLNNYLSTNTKVVATTGPVEWMPMIMSGEMDLGVLGSIDAMQAFNSEGAYEKIPGIEKDNIRLLTSGTPANIGLLVTEDSNVKTIEDLKGKRIGIYYTNNYGATAVALAGLANLGLTVKDIVPLTFPDPAAGIRAMIEGRADGGSSSLGMAVAQELDAGRGARFFSFDPSPEAVKKFKEVLPGVGVVQIKPSSSAPYVKEPVYVSDYPFYLVGSTKLSEETAYQIVKTLWEQNAELSPIHGMLKKWVPDRFIHKDAVVPYHPGAIKFYKEVGVWSQEMDSHQSKLLSKKK